MADRCGIFRLTAENGLDALENDFYLPGYQTHLDLKYKIMDFSNEAMEGLLNRIIPQIVAIHAEAKPTLKPTTFDQTQMIVLTANDLTIIQTQINTSLIYYATIPSTLNPNLWVTQRYTDSIAIQKVWSLLAVNPTMKFVYRKYNPVTYTTSNYTALANEAITYINIDTSVNSESSSIPSNSNITTLGTMVRNKLNTYSGMYNVAMKNDANGHFVYGTLGANSTAKTIPGITFVVRLDTIEDYAGSPNPVVTQNFDKLYNDLKINVASKAYTSDEYSKWLGSGAIVAKNAFRKLGIKSKAGIVEVFRLLDLLKSSPSILHGEINFLFISDAELNRAFKNVTNKSDVYNKILKKTHMCFWVEGEGTAIMSTNSYCIASMKFVFESDGEISNAVVDASRLAVYLQQATKNVEAVIMNFISKKDWIINAETDNYDPVFDPETGFSPITDIAERQQAIRDKYIEDALTVSALTPDLSGYSDSSTSTKVDLTKDIAIKRLEGDKYYAEMTVEVTDLDMTWLNKKVSMIQTLLDLLRQKNFVKSTYTLTKSVAQEQMSNYIPIVMKSLVTEAVSETYGRSVQTVPILKARNILDLSVIRNDKNNQIPSIVISSGGYNYDTFREFIPVYNLEMCAKNMFNIVRLSWFQDYPGF